MTVQYRVQHSLYLYIRSHHCPALLLSQTILGPIDHDNSILFSLGCAYLICPIVILFGFRHRLHMV